MRFNAKQLKEMSNSVRSWALYAVRHAASGHVGIILGASDIITTVYANFMRFDRDRFVLSAGHGSAMLYAVLRLAGYNVGDMASFRQIGGLPGHPEFGIDGVAATTGPLGQGVGNAVGMALAAKIQKTDGRVYCLCGDGDLSEGVAQEAIAFAGIYRLNNLVLLWDDNGITIDGVALVDVDVPARMRAAGWNVISVAGDDFNKLNQALSAAEKSDAPTFVQCKTIIGARSSVAGMARAHGMVLDDGELMHLINKFVSPDGDALWGRVAANCQRIQVVWPDAGIVDSVFDKIDMFVDDEMSTRELSGIALSMLMDAGVNLIGGSADLSASTNARVATMRDVSAENFDGNFINYGVREHAMAAIMNGLVSAGLRAYGTTFLAFCDYMRPAVRLAALSGLPAIYVFTHDSINVGEDGPTHQPIEQLPSLRLIPNLNVFRPCNMAEVLFAWKSAILDTARPSALVLSRQRFKQIASPEDADMTRGAYVIRPASGRRVSATIIATGAEVALAIRVAEKLGETVQVVSMISVEHFRRSGAAYRKQVLRGYVVVIEAAATAAWFEFADAVVGIDEFGASGAAADVYQHFGFDADTIARRLAQTIKL